LLGVGAGVVVVCVGVEVVVLGVVAVVVGVVAVVVVVVVVSGVVLTGAGVLAVGGSEEGPVTVGACAAEADEESTAPAPVKAAIARPPRRSTRRMQAREADPSLIETVAPGNGAEDVRVTACPRSS
jgi:hypothetical protein